MRKLNNLNSLTLDRLHIDKEIVEAICQQKNLTVLKFQGSIFTNGAIFTCNLPALEEFEAIDSQLVDELFITLANNSKNIKHLDLNYSQGLSTNALREIGKLVNLNNLDLGFLENVDKSVVSIIGKKCLQLQNLYLRSCKYGTVMLDLINLKNLKSLDVENNSNIDGNFLLGIAQHCKNLEGLNLSSCFNLSLFDFQHFGVFNNLKKITLHSMVHINNYVITMIADKCKNLDSISMRYCHNVSDSGVMKLIKNCHNLTDLDATGTLITIKSLACAINVTNLRQNNTKLVISVDPELKLIFNELRIETTLLRIDSFGTVASSSVFGD